MYKSRIKMLALLLLALVALVFAGCENKGSSSDPTQKNGATTQSGATSSAEASKTLHDLAKYFPKDSFAFGTLNVEGVTGTLNSYSMLGADFSPAMQKALQKELSAFLMERLGADPMALKWIAAAGDHNQNIVVIVSGEFYNAKSLESVEIEGVKFLKMDTGILIHPLKEKGLSVIAFDKKMAKVFAKISKDPSATLAQDPTRLKGLSDALSDLSGGPLAVVVDTTHPLLKMALPKIGKDIGLSALGGIDRIAFGIGWKVELKLKGDKASIDELSKFYEMGRGILQGEVKKFYGKLNSLDTAEGLMAIFASHLVEPAIGTFKPEFTDNSASLSIDLLRIVGKSLTAPKYATSDLDASKTLNNLSKFLPKESIFFGTFNLQGIIQSTLGSLSLFVADFTPEKQKALEKELSAFLIKRIGIDPLAIEWVAATGASDQTGVVIVSGNFYDAKTLESTEIEGLKFFKLKGGALVHPLAEKGLSVLAIKPKMAAVFAKIQADPTNRLSANKEGFAALSNPLSSLSSGHIVTSVLNTTHPKIKELLNNLSGEIGLSKLSEIDQIAFGMGGKIELRLKGSAGSIEEIKKIYEMGRGMALREIKKLHDALKSLSIEEGIMAILASHLAEPILDSVKPQFTKDEASLVIDFGGTGGAMTTTYIVGVLAAVAIPVFVKFTDDAKTSEAQIQLKSIGHGASAFFQKGLSANMDLTKPAGSISNQYPTEQNTSAGWLKCTSTGNLLGEQQIPNSADYNKSPWRDLMFYIGKPHFYQYCYKSDGKTFTVTATASLRDKDDSQFELRGTIQNGSPTIREIRETK